MNYYKQVDCNGSIIDIVCCEKCPDGYVVATQYEYVQFHKGLYTFGDDPDFL